MPEQRRLSGPGQPLTDSAFETVISNVLSVRKKMAAAGRARTFLAARSLRTAALFVCRQVRENRASRMGFCSPVFGWKKSRSQACFRGSLKIPMENGV